MARHHRQLVLICELAGVPSRLCSLPMPSACCGPSSTISCFSFCADVDWFVEVKHRIERKHDIFFRAVPSSMAMGFVCLNYLYNWKAFGKYFWLIRNVLDLMQEDCSSASPMTILELFVLLLASPMIILATILQSLISLHSVHKCDSIIDNS